MTRFKTKEEFQKFCDESQICLCGRLMTGLHEMNCSRVKKEWLRLKAHDENKYTAHDEKEKAKIRKEIREKIKNHEL